MLSLLTLPVCGKRDLLRARQRARQVAAVLRFEVQDQACVAAGAFAVAAEALRVLGRCSLAIGVENQTLHIFAQSHQVSRSRAHALGAAPGADQGPTPALLRLAKPLPASALSLSPDDSAWVLEQLNRQVPVDLFEEIQRQNQEMLALLHALHTARTQLPHLTDKDSNPSAA